MLNFLREYPEAELPYVRDTVRDTFMDKPTLDDAIECYVNGRPSARDRQAIENCRRMLQLSEENPLHFFAGKVHVRIMRLLGIDKHDLRYILVWAVNAASVITASEFLSTTEPTFSE